MLFVLWAVKSTLSHYNLGIQSCLKQQYRTLPLRWTPFTIPSSPTSRTFCEPNVIGQHTELPAHWHTRFHRRELQHYWVTKGGSMNGSPCWWVWVDINMNRSDRWLMGVQTKVSDADFEWMRVCMYVSVSEHEYKPEWVPVNANGSDYECKWVLASASTHESNWYIACEKYQWASMSNDLPYSAPLSPLFSFPRTWTTSVWLTFLQDGLLVS